MNYHNITYPDQNNGDGLRVVVWVSGCSHHCPECQNPQTWNANSGIEFDKNAEQEVMDQISKDYINGITWSGGDPMFESNIEIVLDITQKIKKQYPNKTVWLYTGYTYDELKKNFNFYQYTPFANVADKWLTRWELFSLCDVIVDGRYKKELQDVSLHWRGSSNQRVIDVQKTLAQNKIILYEDK